VMGKFKKKKKEERRKKKADANEHNLKLET
jgi:hypothetical protein